MYSASEEELQIKRGAIKRPNLVSGLYFPSSSSWETLRSNCSFSALLAHNRTIHKLEGAKCYFVLKKKKLPRRHLLTSFAAPYVAASILRNGEQLMGKKNDSTFPLLFRFSSLQSTLCSSAFSPTSHSLGTLQAKRRGRPIPP